MKSRAELGFLMALEDASGKAEQIGFYETVLGDAAHIFERLERFRAVTADDVLARLAARVRSQPAHADRSVAREAQGQGEAQGRSAREENGAA